MDEFFGKKTVSERAVLASEMSVWVGSSLDMIGMDKLRGYE